MVMEEWDVIIVGGGLGGAAAAIGLAAQGARVLLLEAGQYPRHKMCGEFLSPETVPIFTRLGVWDAIAAQVPPLIRAARLTAPNGATLDSPLPPGALGLSRFRLDALLADAACRAGAEVRENSSVGTVTGSLSRGFHVRVGGAELAARVVIGAWGKRSMLDRALERPFFRREAPFLALKRHVRGIELNDLVELHGFDGGYCGVSAIEEGTVNLCLLTHSRAWERSGKAIDPFWAMIQQENPHLARRLAGARVVSEDIVISNISFAPRAPVEEDVLMVGDSAALISPLAGNGQAMALQAAEAAVELVALYLGAHISADDLREGYARQWRGMFAERIRLGRWLQPLFLNPRALALGLTAGQRLPILVRWLVSGTRQRA